MINQVVWLLGSLLLAPAGPSLGQIQRVVARSWGDSTPGRRFRVRVEFQLKVDRSDPALGTGYFPVARINKRVVNLLRWTEDTTRGGLRYRHQIDYSELPGTSEKPPGSLLERFLFNGSNSYRFEPDYRVAEQGKARSRNTCIFQDYYGDMVGLELLGLL